MDQGTDQRAAGCVTQFVDGRCGRPPTSGLPICGSCLRTLLEEGDPRRRRTLASNPGLAAGVVRQLAEDPDDQVRAQVAARSDLDAATTNRLANPDREMAPRVWRSMAATSGGASHAWELLGTDDPTTLAILAANPSVDPDILEQLARYQDPNVSWTASATLAGQPAADPIADRISEARAFDGLPLGEPATPLDRPDGSSADGGTATTGSPAAAAAATGSVSPDVPASPPSSGVPGTAASSTGAAAAAAAAAGGGGAGALPPRPAPDDGRGGGRRRGMALLVGAGALVVLAAVVLIVAFTGGDSGSRATTIAPTATVVTTTSTIAASTTTTSTTSTTTSTTTTTTLPAPTLPPDTVAPPPFVTPPPPSPISQNFTIRPDTGRFCRAVSVTVNFSPAPAYVLITDDTGAQVGGWSGASGQTKTLQLPRSTSVLNVNVTSAGSSISVSGSATGGPC